MGRRHSPGSARTNSPSLVMWIGIAIVTVILIGTFAISGFAGASVAKKGSTVDFALNDFAGKNIKLSDYRGKPVLVNLWASWCPPCRAEMPDLINYYNSHQTQGLVLLAINSEDTADPAQQFVREKQMPFPVLFDPAGQISKVFGSNGLPSTYLIDRSGNLRFSWTGQISPAVLDQQVTPLLTQ